MLRSVVMVWLIISILKLGRAISYSQTWLNRWSPDVCVKFSDNICNVCGVMDGIQYTYPQSYWHIWCRILMTKSLTTPIFNSLRPSDAYMRQWINHHWFRWWLVAWSTPSHYLNQCWNIVNWIIKNKLQWNSNRNSKIFIQENAFESVVCERVAIFSRPQCVKLDLFHWPYLTIHGRGHFRKTTGCYQERVEDFETEYVSPMWDSNPQPVDPYRMLFHLSDRDHILSTPFNWL